MGGLDARDLPQSAAVGQDIPDKPVSSLAERIENDFTYHAPRAGQPATYEEIRDRAKLLAGFIADVTPAGREQSLALTNLEQAVFWANAAIARAK